jgi:hypothetical protein|tara:strand:+ start:2151 stop:2747 length:597 start_codon:yes stop_codon:yes gene_type:complete
MLKIHKSNLDLNLSALTHSCHLCNTQIQQECRGLEQPIGGTSIPTGLSKHYNIFTSTLPVFFELYKEISKAFQEVEHNTTLSYWIVGWLNVWPNKGKVLPWHGHGGSGGNDNNQFHGYFGVDCDANSVTEYRFKDTTDIIASVHNKNNQLVITNSVGVEHRTSNWEEDFPRITIAFQIQSTETIMDDVGNKLNYYIPV